MTNEQAAAVFFQNRGAAPEAVRCSFMVRYIAAQKRAAAVEFEVKISGRIFGPEKKLDAAVPVNRASKALVHASDISVLDTEYSRYAGLVVKKLRFREGSVHRSFGPELRNRKLRRRSPCRAVPVAAEFRNSIRKSDSVRIHEERLSDLRSTMEEITISAPKLWSGSMVSPIKKYAAVPAITGSKVAVTPVLTAPILLIPSL